MTLSRKLVLLSSLTFLCSKGYTQVFGGDPPSIRWNQINTPVARVIFPRELDSVAERITNILSFINGPTSQTIGNQSRKINIVLKNQTTISNGYVSLGPFRSEFYMTPSPNSFDMGSIPWPDQLAIHEFRHVQQYSNFNVGLSRVMRTLFGQEGQALASDAAIPNWFFEGDAVFNETNLSQQGRGALPSFYNAYRSLWQEQKNYSWMKLRNGSLKDFVPDHYALGFLLVSYGREKYGDDFWKKVTHDAASYKSLLYPFQHAIKKYSGVSFTTFRKEAFHFFQQELDITAMPSRREAYQEEQYPSFTEDGSLIFVQSSFQKIPQLVLKKGNQITPIRTLDYTLDPYFSYRKGKVVYCSYRPDIRWGYRNYSDIQLVDVSSGHQRTLTRKGKYFSPDLSRDGTEVVAVNQAASGQSSLRILSATTGNMIKELPNPDHYFYTYPKFYNKDTLIAAVRNGEGKMSLAVIPTGPSPASLLMPFSFQVIGFPCIVRDTLYFSISYKKEDELFAYTMKDRQLWKIATGDQKGFGKYHPAVSDSLIAWTSFTAEGTRLQQHATNSLQFLPLANQKVEKTTSDFGITALKGLNANLLGRVPDDSFKVTPYRKSFKLFNFHSLEPAIDDPRYTLSLVSENMLNTLQSEVSLSYDRSEKFKELSFTATYGGWFPFLTAGANYLIDRSGVYAQKLIRYNQFEPFAGFNIPLNLSKGRSFTYLNFGSQYVYSKGIFRGLYKDSVSSPAYSYSSSFISFSHQVQSAVQSIFPRFAQSASFTYKTPFSPLRGYQWVIAGNLYFPGLITTHSLVLKGAYLQKDSLNRINFSSNFPFSRGYQAVNFYRMYQWGVSYHLPLAYPDAGFGDIAYLLRVRGNLFYDDTEVTDYKAAKAGFRSVGAELNLDTKWWNQVNVSFGFRYSRLLDKDLFGATGANRWEIILPVNLLNR